MKGDTFALVMADRFGRDRWNEHVKIIANLLNAVSAACIIGALVAPLVNVGAVSSDVNGRLLLGGVGLHFVAHLAMRYIVSKE
jgi:hypothetical protein